MSNVDDQIQKAIEQGKFNNLSGQGKPLNLDENPWEDPAWRTAHHVLKNGGFTLPWIEHRQEIDAELELARSTLERAWAWRRSALEGKQPAAEVEAEWDRARAVFQEQIARLNKRIFAYNLEVPSDRFQKLALKFERELSRITGEPA